ncbi:hypothetical protein TNCV_865411 [Trichonephila clavipes]|nr:hypothetical protein TNCV_865411 [Trichonephila clavipes]
MAHSIGSKLLLLKNFNLHEILNYSVKFSSATVNRSVAANVSKGLKLFDDKFVISATCTCPAGGTQAFCKHVFALLHAINDRITKKNCMKRQQKDYRLGTNRNQDPIVLKITTQSSRAGAANRNQNENFKDFGETLTIRERRRCASRRYHENITKTYLLE